MTPKRSLWLGFSIAPLGAPLAYGIWALFFFTDTTPKQEASEYQYWFFAMTVFFVPASYIASLATGIPLIFTLKRFNKISFWWVTLFAVPLGAVVLTICLFLMLTMGAVINGNIWFEILRFSGVGSALGFVVAAFFCLLVGITDSFKRER